MTDHLCEAMDDEGEDCGRPARRLVKLRLGHGDWQVWGFCEDHLQVPERDLIPTGFVIRAV